MKSILSEKERENRAILAMMTERVIAAQRDYYNQIKKIKPIFEKSYRFYLTKGKGNC